MVGDEGCGSSEFPMGHPSSTPNPRYCCLDGCSLGYPLHNFEGQEKEEVTAYSRILAIQLSFDSAIVFSWSLRVEKSGLSKSLSCPIFYSMADALSLANSVSMLTNLTPSSLHDIWWQLRRSACPSTNWFISGLVKAVRVVGEVWRARWDLNPGLPAPQAYASWISAS